MSESLRTLTNSTPRQEAKPPDIIGYPKDTYTVFMDAIFKLGRGAIVGFTKNRIGVVKALKSKCLIVNKPA